MKLLTKNRKASFEYKFLDTYIAGVKLLGSEVKSVRAGGADIKHSHCYFKGDELYIVGMHIAEYKESGTHQNHDPQRERKLLLHRKELDKLLGGVTKKGITIIPVALLLAPNGYIKLEVALAQGKKLHDKRNDIKERDMARDADREIKGD